MCGRYLKILIGFHMGMSAHSEPGEALFNLWTI